MIDVSEIRRRVAAHPGACWEAGATPLTNLPDEAVVTRLGLYVPPGELDRIARARSRPTRDPLAYAEARDWRDKDGRSYITPAKDQGGCGSSVAFASVATIEAQARIEYQEPGWCVDLSEADLFFGGMYKKCADGWWPPEALNRAKNAGVPEEACFPYKDQDHRYNGCPDRAKRLLRIGEWKELLTPCQRKGWIDTNGPVVACMAVYRDFPSYRAGVYRHVTGDLLGYHAVSCVGYSEPEQAWICKNSWGPHWGDNGFFKIGYGQAEMDTTFSAWGVARVTGTLVPQPGP